MAGAEIASFFHMSKVAGMVPTIDRIDASQQAHYSASHDDEHSQPKSEHAMHGDVAKVSRSTLAWMTMLSFVPFAFGLAVAAMFGGP